MSLNKKFNTRLLKNIIKKLGDDFYGIPPETSTAGFKAATPPCKRSAVKRNTSTRRQAATSRAAQADLFTSEMKWSVFTSKSSLEFGEDVKKRLRLLSEVVLRTVKRRLASSFHH